MVYRIYVEKKPEYAVEADSLKNELVSMLGIKELKGLRILNRYDVEGIEGELFRRCKTTVFSEPPVDRLLEAVPEADAVFAVEYLPGQFDQRADSASQCIQLISQGERPEVSSAKVYLLSGGLSPEQVERVKKYVINPVEAREAELGEKATLHIQQPKPQAVEVLEGFRRLSDKELGEFLSRWGLAMDLGDISACREYFRAEGRDPTVTEIKMIDTYWSDHCRHTTFGTIIDQAEIRNELVQAAFDRYMRIRRELGREEKPRCLMDLGTIGGKYLKAKGILKNLDESEEINACTVKIKCDVNGEDQDWLFLFKNETHNHPTEIEPFGGAATCIGGAIRDPLSGRSYVYQAMRVTGAGDPTAPVSETLPGKLPQRKLVTTAAAGYSSYGNQIGLATGQVSELYHPGYVAKRMEIGAVVGATPADHVRRERPEPGDVIVLLGGATGRDGIGGATGSSKAHKQESLASCGAEVQKGNAPVERKLQRLFRRGDACRLIKRCNDFGAGGVSVAVGELAEGLHINLDNVTKKYEGLDGTELAISESQERMAVALAPEDVEKFTALAGEENLEATPIAVVTEEKRLVMEWNGDVIVDISREFLDSNGAEKHVKVLVEEDELWSPSWEGESLKKRMSALVSDLNVCSQKGLSERFDSTIGAATVLMPFGGIYQLTPEQTMVAKLPVDGETKTCSGMAWGFNPYLMEKSPYRGAYLAVVESVSKLISAGFETEKTYLTFQEYFQRLGETPERWGQPMAALLGALDAQLGLGIGAIGGKDSMSGSFEKLNVPPTLVSFATAVGNVDRVVSTEFKKRGSKVILLRPEYTNPLLPELSSQKKVYAEAERLIGKGRVLSAATPGYGCLAECLFKMGLGNRIGFKLTEGMDWEELFKPSYGCIVLELTEGESAGTALGETQGRYCFTAGGESADMAELQELWESRLESVTPYRAKGETVRELSEQAVERKAPAILTARPKVIIPVFPGTNCEYDSARAFQRVGAEARVLVINNQSPKNVAESCAALTKAIDESQMIMLPGGFSGGDEPDGSAKFIAAFFRAPAVTEAVRRLLQQRDGLMLGICNGFQALIKLGLLPYGDIRSITEDDPTLTYNTIGRHQSMLVRTRVSSNMSPWLSKCQVGDCQLIAVSHGEGRLAAPQKALDSLIAGGQIATQYVDMEGRPTMDLSFNPNGSALAIEGISSPDGRILGKMGHSERSGESLYKNIPGVKYQALFEGGVDYFRL